MLVTPTLSSYGLVQFEINIDYFVGEICIPSLKGALGFSFQLMVVLGILITSLFGLGLDWRLISAIMAVFPVISILSMIYVPESPYYLVKKGISLVFSHKIQNSKSI